MSSAIQKLSAAAETTGLSFDRERNILYGTFGAYTFAVLVNASNVRFCSVFFHVTRDGNPFTADDGKEIARESNKLIQFVKPAGAAPASFLVKLDKDEEGTAQRILDALNFLSTAFSNRGYDGGEVVIGQDHIRHGFGNVRSRDAHTDTDIGTFD